MSKVITVEEARAIALQTLLKAETERCKRRDREADQLISELEDDEWLKTGVNFITDTSFGGE